MISVGIDVSKEKSTVFILSSTGEIIKEAYELCKKSGIDSDMQVTEYENNVKIVIRMKK